MDTSIKADTHEEAPARKIIGYRCTSDGKHWAEFAERRCRYCIPIYEDETAQQG